MNRDEDAESVVGFPNAPRERWCNINIDDNGPPNNADPGPPATPPGEQISPSQGSIGIALTTQGAGRPPPPRCASGHRNLNNRHNARPEDAPDADVPEKTGVGLFALVLMILLFAKVVSLGIAGSTLSELGGFVASDGLQLAMGVVLVASVAEIVLYIVVCPICACCCDGGGFFIGIGLVGLEVLGTSIFLLYHVGLAKNSSMCPVSGGDARWCLRSLNMALALGCLRILVIVPGCIGLTIGYLRGSITALRRRG